MVESMHYGYLIFSPKLFSSIFMQESPTNWPIQAFVHVGDEAVTWDPSFPGIHLSRGEPPFHELVSFV